MYALIDINNFYASCERIFNPNLRNKPVCVLSNNDGCIVARSNEIKAAGIPMGAPYFKYKDKLDEIGAVVFSSNYALYGDMSARVMSLLAQFGNIEVYSIDEAFLECDHIATDQLYEFGLEIQQTVSQYLGLPCCVGFGNTKTLAKVANETAKKDSKLAQPVLHGVCVLADETQVNKALENLEVREIWGIGRKYSQYLINHGILTAKQFKDADETWVKKTLKMVGARTQRELKGFVGVGLDSSSETKKSIISSRSFGKNVCTKVELSEAVSTYTSRVAEKLRKQKSCTTALTVFILTNRFGPKKSYYYGTKSAILNEQTNFTADLVIEANKLLDEIYVDGLKYKKAGVIVWGLVDEDKTQKNIFHDTDEYEKIKLKQAVISKTIDSLNKKFGNHSLKIGSMGVKQDWNMKSGLRSDRFTTVWDELLTIDIDRIHKSPNPSYTRLR
jgi:DNA polymerase V